MAYKITEDCSNCGACEAECPNRAISAGSDTYVIDPDKCTECVGFFDTPQCAAVCPTDSCVPDPDKPETESELIQKVKRLHPNKNFDGDIPSRFKK